MTSQLITTYKCHNFGKTDGQLRMLRESDLTEENRENEELLAHRFLYYNNDNNHDRIQHYPVQRG